MQLSARGLALVGLGALVLAAPLWGPHLLRRVSWFEVRRVEISGTRLLAPHTVLAASGLSRGHNVWDDAGQWERALRAHPAIADARVSRRFPGTLRIRVDEKQPVALVEADALRPATAAGELLPVDPASSPVDLPIVRGWAEPKQRPAARLLLAEVGRLGRLDPALIAELSEVRASEADPRLLLLSHRLGEIILPAGAGADRLAELRAVLNDLERRLGDAPAAVPAAARVDLRYRDQIVVRLPSSV